MIFDFFDFFVVIFKDVDNFGVEFRFYVSVDFLLIFLVIMGSDER